MRTRSIFITAALVTATVIGGASTAAATDPSPGAGAWGKAKNSPGVLSGNVVQVPVDLSVNACGNTVNVVGLLNPAAGNTCVSK
ncbi:chaplin [Streptomyces sp. NPDC050732]|uniref:chaplin n=1 Tax=Streptomyces sp. NPDC050732 TaxID=3154632 RepID=UPI00343E0CBE